MAKRGPQPGPAQLRAKQVLADFPELSSKQLGVILRDRYPLVYSSPEAGRWQIQKLRGAVGNSRRHTAVAPPSPFSTLLGTIPRGVVLRDTSPFRIAGPKILGVIGDLHFPYHSREAIRAALDYMNERAIEGLLINGDGIDNHNQSRFQKDPHARSFEDESAAFIQFLETLHKLFPGMPIWYKEGNHEARHEAYLMSKCPEIYGHSKFQLEHILELERLGIKYIKDKRRILFGRLAILHGHEYRGGFVAPVNPARGMYMRAKTSVLAHHFHQDSKHSAKDLHGQIVGCWTSGCLCELNPLFQPYNEWSHGFAIAELLDNAGRFRVELKHISKGKVF